MPEIALGQLVIPRAGRDKGRVMIVVRIIDSDYVYIADGDLRKVEKPKKKKIKHLKVLNKISKDIALKLAKKRKLSNEEIKLTLEKLIDDNVKRTSNQI
jgi:large subunit ribosomal protein L14e